MHLNIKLFLHTTALKHFEFITLLGTVVEFFSISFLLIGVKHFLDDISFINPFAGNHISTAALTQTLHNTSQTAKQC